MNDDNKAIEINDQQAIAKAQDTNISVAEQEETQAVDQYSQSKGTTSLTMHVRVYSPFHVYYDGQAFSISATNDTGPFDVLPEHHNFISLLSACELVVRAVDHTGQKSVKILISGGLIHVKANEVLVFLDV